MSDQLVAARLNRAKAQKAAFETAERLRYAQGQADAMGPLAALHKDARTRRDGWLSAVHSDQADLTEATRATAHWDAELARLKPLDGARAAWAAQNDWRVEQVAEAQAQLDRHWARAVFSTAKQGDPLAFGIDRLRRARRYFAKSLDALESSLPPDRTAELARAEADLAHHLVNHAHAGRCLARADRRLQEATSRRRPSRDKSAIARAEDEIGSARLDVARTAELVVKASALVAREQQAVSDRDDAEAQTVEERTELRQALRTIDQALVLTRADRVRQALDGPLGAPLRQLLGPPPQEPASRAVWCGIAYRVETVLDEPSEAARLVWSKDRLDRLTRGLLDAEPEAVARAQAIIAGSTDITVDRRALADPAAWERTTRAAADSIRSAHRSRPPDLESSLGR